MNDRIKNKKILYSGNKDKVKHTFCKKCGKRLEGIRAKLWGICGECDD